MRLSDTDRRIRDSKIEEIPHAEAQSTRRTARCYLIARFQYASSYFVMKIKKEKGVLLTAVLVLRYYFESYELQKRYFGSDPRKRNC